MSVRLASSCARAVRQALVLCVAVAGGVRTTEAQIRPAVSGGTILVKDANLFVQQEATAEALALFGRVFGDDPMRAMPWTGTISDLGWTYTLSSPYRNGNLTLNYSGAYNPSTNTISWNGTLNFIGSTNPLRAIVSIATRGTFSDATIDGFWDVVSDVLEVVEEATVVVHRTATVVALAGFEAIAVPESETVGGPEVLLIASEKVNEWDNGFVEQNSSSFHQDAEGNSTDTEHLRPLSGRPPARPSPPFPPPYFGALLVTTSGQITSPFTDPVVTNAGTVTVAAVPEPETVVLFAAGLLLTGGICHRRRSEIV